MRRMVIMRPAAFTGIFSAASSSPVFAEYAAAISGNVWLASKRWPYGRKPRASIWRVRSTRCRSKSSSRDKGTPWGETSYYNVGLRSLSIVIPAYNEEQRLPSTLETILAYLRRPDSGFAPWELIVVNDGSKDGTAALVKRLAESEPNLRLVENPGNKGKGYSVRNGMLQARHEWVLFSDADLSAPIDELPKLFAAAARDQADVAIGSRALDRSLIGTHQSPFREFGGRFFNLMVQLGTGLRLWDTQCGFKLFRREAAQAVFQRLQLQRFGFDVEALFIARRLGFRIVEEPVRWNHVDGTKVSMLRDSIDMFGDIVRVRMNSWKGLYK